MGNILYLNQRPLQKFEIISEINKETSFYIRCRNSLKEILG